MLKKSLLIIAALVAAFQSLAAPVDVATAKATAKQYLTKQYAGKFMAPEAIEPTLIMTEKGDVNKETPVFYIFNTSTTYLIVSGDDRAEEILAVGDKPLNLDRIPDGLRYLMDCYKEQLDWLISNPEVQVEKTAKLRDGAKESVQIHLQQPLLSVLHRLPRNIGCYGDVLLEVAHRTSRCCTFLHRNIKFIIL